MVEGLVDGEYGMADAVSMDKGVVTVGSYIAGLAGIDPELWISAADPEGGPDCGGLVDSGEGSTSP